MRKVLVFYISDFGGHSQAARNVKEALQYRDSHCNVLSLNGFSYFFPVWEKIIDWVYTRVVRHMPHLWGKIYDRKNLVKRLGPLRQWVNKRSFVKVSELIRSYQPSCIVATQAFPCGIVADFKEKTGIAIPLVAVVTDYHPHRFWIHSAIDIYTVACEDARQVLIKEGVDPHKIKVLGIPISVNFLETHSKMAVCQELGFIDGLPAVIIMGGGLGIGPLEHIARRLDALAQEFQMIVICGKNKKMFRRFCKTKHQFRKPLTCYSYIEFVHKIMDFADIIITKGGGITISESLAKGLGIIITNPIPGQEERNVAHLLQRSAIMKVDTVEEITGAVKILLQDKTQLYALKEMAKEHSIVDSSLRIAELILGLN